MLSVQRYSTPVDNTAHVIFSFNLSLYMTLYEFKLSDEAEQIMALWNKGVYLTERIDGEYTFKLYQIDSFYVEEQWHTKFNVRRAFISFISQEKLVPYLNTIDLSTLPVPINKNNL